MSSPLASGRARSRRVGADTRGNGCVTWGLDRVPDARSRWVRCSVPRRCCSRCRAARSRAGVLPRAVGTDINQIQLAPGGPGVVVGFPGSSPDPLALQAAPAERHARLLPHELPRRPRGQLRAGPGVRRGRRRRRHRAGGPSGLRLSRPASAETGASLQQLPAGFYPRLVSVAPTARVDHRAERQWSVRLRAARIQARRAERSGRHGQHGGPEHLPGGLVGLQLQDDGGAIAVWQEGDALFQAVQAIGVPVLQRSRTAIASSGNGLSGAVVLVRPVGLGDAELDGLIDRGRREGRGDRDGPRSGRIVPRGDHRRDRRERRERHAGRDGLRRRARRVVAERPGLPELPGDRDPRRAAAPRHLVGSAGHRPGGLARHERAGLRGERVVLGERRGGPARDGPPRRLAVPDERRPDARARRPSLPFRPERPHRPGDVGAGSGHRRDLPEPVRLRHGAGGQGTRLVLRRDLTDPAVVRRRDAGRSRRAAALRRS